MGRGCWLTLTSLLVLRMEGGLGDVQGPFCPLSSPSPLAPPPFFWSQPRMAQGRPGLRRCPGPSRSLPRGSAWLAEGPAMGREAGLCHREGLRPPSRRAGARAGWAMRTAPPESTGKPRWGAPGQVPEGRGGRRVRAQGRGKQPRELRGQDAAESRRHSLQTRGPEAELRAVPLPPLVPLLCPRGALRQGHGHKDLHCTGCLGSR